MTPEEHERERRAFWDACCAAPVSYVPEEGVMNFRNEDAEAAYCAELADAKLAERDKRWPGPERTGSLVSTVKCRPAMPEDKP